MGRAFLCLCLLVLGSGEILAKPPRSSNPPNILLIVIDTLRYSATSFPDPTRNNTPFLATLASRGVLFTNAYSTHDFTPTSHFSMFTGLYDGLDSDDDRIENGLPFQLSKAGYDTFGTVANALIGKKQMPVFGGFAEFKQPGDITTGSILDSYADMADIDARLAMFNCRPTAHARAMVYFKADRLLPIFLQQLR
ncbi:MAG TPA: sulfatase-like hydrolase/transferase, partial [Thermoanaerobaculia bacterium]